MSRRSIAAVASNNGTAIIHTNTIGVAILSGFCDKLIKNHDKTKPINKLPASPMNAHARGLP